MESVRKESDNHEGRRRYQQNDDIQSKKIPIDDKNIRIKISPREIDYNKSFTEEIPEQFRYKEYMDNLIKSVNQDDNSAADQQSAWWNIYESAQNLDKQLESIQGKLIILKDNPEVRQNSRDLKYHSISYLDKYKDNIENEDYDGEDNKKLITTKLSLIARKMIHKLVCQCENSGDFNGKDDKGKDIEEGAKDVKLVLGKKIEDGKVVEDPTLHYKDCKYQELFEHDPEAKDCLQLRLGDCWLQAALIAILTKRGSKPIKDMFKDEGDSGYVRVRLYYPKGRTDDKGNITNLYKWSWKPKYYRVPKQIPVNKNDEPIYNSGANWVHYLQAAIAKSGIRNKANDDRNLIDPVTGPKTRNYASNLYGGAWIGWKMIFGDSIKVLRILPEKIHKEQFKEKADQFYDQVKKAVDAGKLMNISFDPKSLKHHDRKVGISGGEFMDRGLVTNHVYAVIGAEEIDGVKYIRLINPWYSRKGREYIDYTKGKKGDKGKKREASFKGKDDESFLLKATTFFRHLKSLYVEI